ncbi:hypothetical protein PoB_007714600 [Plakobranchus ocellatus]|uniref:Uncharacterized protein n=1 Tax=Plakobranchus ocellatus TaxID=259542 RepID=A0AAV4E478_9GAST|nr:hypothetical protein PoB_007714600 [Plakobranchus ocellatus]
MADDGASFTKRRDTRSLRPARKAQPVHFRSILLEALDQQVKDRLSKVTRAKLEEHLGNCVIARQPVPSTDRTGHLQASNTPGDDNGQDKARQDCSRDSRLTHLKGNAAPFTATRRTLSFIPSRDREAWPGQMKRTCRSRNGQPSDQRETFTRVDKETILRDKRPLFSPIEPGAYKRLQMLTLKGEDLKEKPHTLEVHQNVASQKQPNKKDFEEKSLVSEGNIPNNTMDKNIDTSLPNCKGKLSVITSGRLAENTSKIGSENDEFSGRKKREVGLQKLRRTFTERKPPRSPVWDDCFHGDSWISVKGGQQCLHAIAGPKKCKCFVPLNSPTKLKENLKLERSAKKDDHEKEFLSPKKGKEQGVKASKNGNEMKEKLSPFRTTPCIRAQCDEEIKTQPSQVRAKLSRKDRCELNKSYFTSHFKKVSVEGKATSPPTTIGRRLTCIPSLPNSKRLSVLSSAQEKLKEKRATNQSLRTQTQCNKPELNQQAYNFYGESSSPLKTIDGMPPNVRSRKNQIITSTKSKQINVFTPNFKKIRFSSLSNSPDKQSPNRTLNDVANATNGPDYSLPYGKTHKQTLSHKPMRETSLKLPRNLSAKSASKWRGHSQEQFASPRELAQQKPNATPSHNPNMGQRLQSLSQPVKHLKMDVKGKGERTDPQADVIKPVRYDFSCKCCQSPINRKTGPLNKNHKSWPISKDENTQTRSNRLGINSVDVNVAGPDKNEEDKKIENQSSNEKARPNTDTNKNIRTHSKKESPISESKSIKDRRESASLKYTTAWKTTGGAQNGPILSTEQRAMARKVSSASKQTSRSSKSRHQPHTSPTVPASGGPRSEVNADFCGWLIEEPEVNSFATDSQWPNAVFCRFVAPEECSHKRRAETSSDLQSHTKRNSPYKEGFEREQDNDASGKSANTAGLAKLPMIFSRSHMALSKPKTKQGAFTLSKYRGKGKKCSSESIADGDEVCGDGELIRRRGENVFRISKKGSTAKDRKTGENSYSKSFNDLNIVVSPAKAISARKEEEEITLCELMESCNQTAMRLVGLSQSVCTLGTLIEKNHCAQLGPNSGKSGPKMALKQSGNDREKTKVYGYLMTALFMALQILAHYVFVRR